MLNEKNFVPKFFPGKISEETLAEQLKLLEKV